MHTRSQHQNGPLSLPRVASSTPLSPSLSLAGDGFDTRLTLGHPVTRERERERERESVFKRKRDERERGTVDGFLSLRHGIVLRLTLSSSPYLPRHRNDKTAPPLLPLQLAVLDDQLRSARVEQQQLVDGRRARYEFFCLQALQGDASAAIGLRSSPSFARSWSPKDLGPEQRAREGGDKLTLCGEKRVPRTVASERESGERRSIQNKEAAAGGVR